MEECKYCSVEVDDREYLICNYCEGVYIDGNGFLTADDKLDFDEKQLNYCPICGKGLH